MYYRCCVANCKSIRQKVKLHGIPIGSVRKLWLKAIVAVSPNITDQIYTGKLQNTFICHKHFERRFISEKNRVAINGYPSLFTEEEIASGVPSKVDPEIAVRDSARTVARDHGCTRRLHVDHTYAKINNDGDKWMTQLIVSGIPGTQILEKSIDVNPDAKDTQTEVPPDIEPVPEVEETFVPDYDDVQVSPSPLPEVEDSGGETVFSWLREEELLEADEPPADPTLALFCESDSAVDLDLVCDPQRDRAVPSVPANVDNGCKDCQEVNVGFEFWCVQCAGGALCGACAGRAPHHAHYVLRAPMGCSRARTQAVLTMIRQQLQNQNLSQHGTVDDDLKLEVKEEPSEVPPAPSPPAEPDPLACEPHEPISLDEPDFPHDLIESVSLRSPISLHSSRSSSRSPHSPTSVPSRPASPPSPLTPRAPASPPEPAVTPEPATLDADKSIAEKIVDYHEPQPPRLRKPTDAHEEILSIPTQRKLVKESPGEVKRAFLSHLERVVTTQNKQAVPQPSETVTIDLDVADETVECLEEGLESDIETVDNHEDDVLDEDDFDNDVLDENDLSDGERIVRNVPGRGVKRKKIAF